MMRCSVCCKGISNVMSQGLAALKLFMKIIMKYSQIIMKYSQIIMKYSHKYTV